MQPQPKPAAAESAEQSLADAYEINESPEQTTSTPAVVAGGGQPAAASTPPPAPSSQPRDPVTKRFLSPADVTGEEPARVVHPTWLYEQATELGMSEDEINATPTDTLGRSVKQISKTLLEDARQNARVQVRDLSESRQAQSGDNASARQEEASPLEGFDFGTDESGAKLTEKSYDAGIMKLFKEQARQIKELRQQIGELSTREVQRENLTMAQRIDRHFAKLNDPRFGTAGHDSLTADSKEYNRRLAVLREAARLAGPKASQQQMMAKITAAIANLYGDDETPAPAARSGSPRRQADEEQQTWEAGGLARPTQRMREPVANGVKKATANVQRKLDEAGRNGELDDIGDDDFLG